MSQLRFRPWLPAAIAIVAVVLAVLIFIPKGSQRVDLSFATDVVVYGHGEKTISAHLTPEERAIVVSICRGTAAPGEPQTPDAFGRISLVFTGDDGASVTLYPATDGSGQMAVDSDQGGRLFYAYGEENAAQLFRILGRYGIRGD